MMKGQFGIQFNWIFVLVGGFLFLLFFFLIIRQVINTGDESDDRRLSFDVETTVAASPSSPNTFTIMNVRNARYQFICEQDVLGIQSYLRIDGGDFNPAGLEYAAVFSPRVVEGNELFLSTRKWKAPMPVTTLVLLSNNRTRYVFVTPMQSAAANTLQRFLQDENLDSFGYDIVDSNGWPGNYQDEGYDQYRIIFFGTPYSPSNVFNQNQQNTALAIPSGNPETGQFYFYDSVTNSRLSGSYNFSGAAMLAAAIFSQDEQQFRCNMGKLIGRWNTSLAILEERLQIVANSPQWTDLNSCQLQYRRANTTLWTRDDSGSPITRNPLLLSRADLNGLAGLEQANEALLRNSCPQVY